MTTTPTNTRSQGGAESAVTDEQIIAAVARVASNSLNVTRVHELGGITRTMMEEAGLIEIGRALLALAAPASAQEAPKERGALEEISSLMSSMFASARAHVQGPDETIVGYTVRNGALHKIAGILASYKPVIIPSNLPKAHETITGVLCGTSSAAVQQGEPRSFAMGNSMNRYCRAGMCVDSDEKHEPECVRAALASAQPKTGEA